MSILVVSELHHSVRRHFWTRPKPILRGVSFTVEPGEIFGFLGPNGAGKTTTIKAMLGLLRPSRGAVQMFGLDVREPRARARVGFLPERAYFPEHLSGRELVLQHALLAGLPAGRARTAARDALERVKLDADPDIKLRSYSKGMLQRVGLAQAIVGDPDLVVLDEPMSGLDPLGRRDVRDLMLNLRQQGKTVFFSTHIIPDVELICDRVAILVGGSLRRVGTLTSLLEQAEGGVEITSEPLSPAALEAARPVASAVREHAGGHILEAADAARANTLIDILRGSGVRIRTVQSVRTSLEEIFVTEAQGKPIQEARP